MRRKEREITDKDEIESVVSRARICRLGLCRDNLPYVVPVNFGYSNNRLYIHSSREGMKIDILKVNNRVCFEMEADVELVQAEKPCDWTARYHSVIGFGTAHIVEDIDEKRAGLDIIMDHYGDMSARAYAEPVVEKVVIIRIDVESMTGKKSGY